MIVNRASIESVNGFKRTNSWSYDSLYRLASEIIKTNGGNSSLGYSYDSVGNRLGRTIAGSNLNLTNQTFTFNTNDWLNTDKYDSNGNTTNASGNAYQYDALNHVTNVNNTVFITYDGNGNRVSKKIGGTTTYYLLDDRNPSGYAQVLEEWTSTGTPVLSRVYNYGLSLISQRQPNVSTNYFVYDGHGATRVLLDAGGNVVNTFAYDAYGTLIASSATPQTAYLYCGQQFDTDLGLYYNRARYFNAGTGRFWTMDSYNGNNQDPLSLHKYLYCHDNPVNGSDPLGQSFFAFDGTGNYASEIDDGVWSPTNVRKMFLASTDPDRHYEIGVGTALNNWDLFGQGFGYGMADRVDTAMGELIKDRIKNDKQLDIVGFSRGGIEATEFANRVADAYPDETIRFVGLFDPVGSVGFPGSFGSYRTQLPASVQYSVEAMAKDENRDFFPATDVNVTTKRWFRGTHSDIGGGWADHQLSDFVLQWMVEQAQGKGVGIDWSIIKSWDWDPNENGPINPNRGFTSWFTTKGARTVLSPEPVQTDPLGGMYFTL